MDKAAKKGNLLLRIFFGALTVVAVLVSIFLSNNSFRMHDVVQERTDSYLEDVSHQIAVHINSRIKNSVQMLRMLRDSAIYLPDNQVQSFLERKRAFSEYDELYLFADHQEAEAWLAERYPKIELCTDEEERPDAELFSIYDEDTIIYCVGDSADSDPSVIVGIKTKEALRSLLSQSSFDGEGYSFAITGNGVVITAPTDVNLYDELEKREAVGEESIVQVVEEMEATVAAGQSGILSFVDERGVEMLLRYEPLNYSGWYLVTAIPSGLISADVEALSQTNTFLTTVVIALLLASMAAILLGHRSSRRKLERLAFVDPVTGGMNDTRFRIAAQEALEGNEEKYVLVSTDVEGFKLINKVYGAQEGNRTLKHIHNVLRSSLAEYEPMARDTADVFFFLLKNRGEEEICARLNRIYDNVNAFNQNRESPYYIELRFGVYVPSEEGEDLVDMQEKSNLARKSQQDGSHGRCHFYDEATQEKTVQEKELAGMVDRSLRSGDFQVYLQPKVSLEDKRVAGAEALIRWKHPEKGMLSPAMFIPMAEKYRLISRLDLFVFEEVCRTLDRWKREGKELLVISVNLSRQNLDDPDFLEDYRRICAQYEVVPSLIEFELTETIMFENPQGVKSIIDEIHALGFRCSLDDFGTGFSALGLLNDLDVDVIKLDRSFFCGKNNSRRGRYIVESILKLAAQLHIRTVAEGIDNLQQVQYLRQAACNMIQGFYFFRPMPIGEFEDKVFDNGALRYVEMGEERAEEPGEERSRTPMPEPVPGGNIVMFSYFPKEDEVVFSSPFSPALEGQYTLPNARALFRSSELIHESDREDFFRMLDRCQREGEWVENTIRFYMSQGRYQWLEVHLHRGGRSTAGSRIITGILVNMAGWKSELNRWKEKANRDALTGLYNREFFEQYVNAQLTGGALTAGAVIFIDIDDFKNANDTLGHVFGDDILCCMAKRILGVFRSTDIVARYGGDEFVVFVGNVSRKILMERLAKLCEVFRQPYRSGTLRYKISGSIGAAVFPEDGADYETLLENADSALYEAKRGGKDQYVLYRPKTPGGEEAPGSGE